MDDQASEAMADRGMLVGGVTLLSVGSGLVLLGATLSAVVAARASRRWVQQWDDPPSVVARRRLGQARSAVVAGSQGWRQNGTAAVTSSRG